MLEKIKIEGLRGIVEADIDELAPVTFFVGSNGSGKSTVLEAIGIVCAGFDAASAFRALSKREWLGLKTFEYLFTGEGGLARISFGDKDGEHSTSVGIASTNTALLAQARRSDESALAALTLSENRLKQTLID